MSPIFLPLMEASLELTFRIVCRTLMDSSEIWGTLWKQCPFKHFCIFVNKEITRVQIRYIEAWATAILLVAKNCCTDWAVCTGVLSYLINHPQFCCCSRHFQQTYFLKGCKTFHKNTEQVFGLDENISVEQCHQSQKWTPSCSWCLTWFVLLSLDIERVDFSTEMTAVWCLCYSSLPTFCFVHFHCSFTEYEGKFMANVFFQISA